MSNLRLYQFAQIEAVRIEIEARFFAELKRVLTEPSTKEELLKELDRLVPSE